MAGKVVAWAEERVFQKDSLKAVGWVSYTAVEWVVEWVISSADYLEGRLVEKLVAPLVY